MANDVLKRAEKIFKGKNHRIENMDIVTCEGICNMPCIIFDREDGSKGHITVRAFVIFF